MAIYIEYIWQCHFYPSMPLEYTMFILVAYPAHQCRVYHIWFSVIWFNLNCNWSPKVARIRKRICRILSPAEFQCHCQMQQVPLKSNIFSFFIMLTINCLEKCKRPCCYIFSYLHLISASHWDECPSPLFALWFLTFSFVIMIVGVWIQLLLQETGFKYE